MKRAHSDSKERLRCACCDFTTSSKPKLKRHEESVHGKENLVCSVCHVICVGVRCLNDHLKTSHGRPELYKCDQCSYFSYKRSNLTKHLKTHTASLSLSCQHCDFACKWSNELKRHVQKAHPETSDGSQMKQCTMCDYKTVSSQHLRRHVQNKHEEEHVKNAFKCRFCSYSTSAMDNLRKHVLKTTHHQGAPFYFCSICGEFQTNETSKFRLHLSDQHGKDKHAVKDFIDQFFLPTQEVVIFVGEKVKLKSKQRRKQHL